MKAKSVTFSPKEVAAILPFSVQAIRRMARLKQVRSFRNGFGPKAPVRIPKSEVARLAKRAGVAISV